MGRLSDDGGLAGSATYPPRRAGTAGIAAKLPSVNVEDFGAVGDHRYTTDAAITSGSNVLTSAGGYIDGTVGKRVTIAGAGPAGADLVGTILTAAPITLDVNASTTVSGARAWWGTDNSAAIQAAINALPNNSVYTAVQGGTVVFPAGKYRVESTVTLIENVRFEGYGAKNISNGNSFSAGATLQAATHAMTLLSANSAALSIWQNGFRLDGVNLDDVTGATALAPGTCTLLSVKAVNRWTLANLAIRQALIGVYMDHAGLDCAWWVIDNCSLIANGTGAKSAGGSGVGGTFLGGDIDVPAGANVGIDSDTIGAPLRVLGTKFDCFAGSTGIKNRGGYGTYSGVMFENRGATAIDTDGGTIPDSITDCIFYEHNAGGTAWLIGSSAVGTQLFGNRFYPTPGSAGAPATTDNGTGTIRVDGYGQTQPQATGQVPLNLVSTPVGTSAGSTTATNSSALGGIERYNTSGTQNDVLDYEISLASGTYTLDLFHTLGSNHAIYTVQIADVSANGTVGAFTPLGTVDAYGAAPAFAIGTLTGLVIKTGGRKRFRLKAATRNASNTTGYYIVVSAATFSRTA